MHTLLVRSLGNSDRAEVQRVLDRDPYGAVTVAERLAISRRGAFSGDGVIYGYGARRRLQSVCWCSAHVIPVQASPAAVAAFSEVLAEQPRSCSSIIGDAEVVQDMWHRLEPVWGPARQVRACQPLLVADAPPAVVADPAVRLVRPDELDPLWSAAAQMYTEEVGVSPLVEDGGRGHRARVASLVRAGRSYARVVDGQVIFKADVAAVSRHTAQIQGVWVAPQWRRRGIGTAAMAAVVRDTLRRFAPTVSLYVNDYNHAARSVYQRCGFRQVGTLATVLF